MKKNKNSYRVLGFISLIIAFIIIFALSPLAVTYAEEVDPPVESVPESSTPEPTPQPTPQPTPEPTPEPTPQPTPQPTPEPTPEPTPQPTPEPTPQPTPQPEYSEPAPVPNNNNNNNNANTPPVVAAATPRPSSPSPSPRPSPTPRPTPRPTATPDDNESNYVVFARLDVKSNSLAVNIFYLAFAMIATGSLGLLFLIVLFFKNLRNSRSDQDNIFEEIEDAEIRHNPAQKRPEAQGGTPPEQPKPNMPARSAPSSAANNPTTQELLHEARKLIDNNSSDNRKE